MKKLILVLLTGLFLCNTSYGATIKELLNVKKSIKLSCIIEKSTIITLKPYKFEDNPERVGDKIFVEVKNKAFFINGHEYYFGEIPFIINDVIFRHEVSKINLSDDYILLENYYKYPEKQRPSNKSSWKINRYTGEFRNEDNIEGFTFINTGTCEKSKDKKF